MYDFFLFIFFVSLISIIIIIILTLIERTKEKNEFEKLSKSGIDQIDAMTGREFEIYLSVLFRNLGYKVKLTKASGDYGADLILKKSGLSIVVQAKRYKKKVGVKSVQEITSARFYYSSESSWVVTNNYFTSPAIELAEKTDVKLFDRDDLVNLILKSKESNEKIIITYWILTRLTLRGIYNGSNYFLNRKQFLCSEIVFSINYQ